LLIGKQDIVAQLAVNRNSAAARGYMGPKFSIVHQMLNVDATQ